MSEFNEELLNDDTDDFPEIGEAEENALLQDDDDGDVLDLVPEEELVEPSEPDQKHAVDTEEKRSRADKFATERKTITAPEPTAEEKPHNNRFGGRGRGRGARPQQYRYQRPNFNQGRQYNHGPQPGRNKTVLINPRFQGVVHVNNNGARLAWDTQQQQQFPNAWACGGPPPNMGPPMQPMQAVQPMQAMQGPHMHFQPPMQPFPQMPVMQGHSHMQQMHQGPPMQNVGPPGQQLQFMPPHQQQAFMPQPLPPGVPQSPMQPSNLPAPSSYWDFQNQVTSFPQGQHQQMMPYMQNNFESQQPVMVNTNQPHQMQPPNYQYNSGPQQNFMQQNRQGFPNSNNMRRPHGNMGPNKMFSPKRKVASVPFVQNKKRFIHDRLGSMEQSQVKIQNVTIKTEDRPSVVKEVTVTNVTTVKIEDDEQTRDLRQKIEEQRLKREQVLKWKELRRLQNLKEVARQPKVEQRNPQPFKPVQRILRQGLGRVGRGGHQPNYRVHEHGFGGSIRTPVLQPVQQIDEQRQVKGRRRNQRPVQNVNQRVIITPAVAAAAPPVPAEEPVVQLDKQQLSTFLADRKVLVKDEALMSTRKVVIKNIATSTGDKKIFKICQSIGEVQRLHRDKNESNATITFKSVASAHAFFKKYQRHMLDLSMIEVSLTPELDGQE